MSPCSGDGNGGWKGNGAPRTAPSVWAMVGPVNLSGLWLSYGPVVLNLLFWMYPTLNVKWWISSDFKPPTLDSINKYSFSFSPSSSIFSSIMAEVTAANAFFIHLYMILCTLTKLWNYWRLGGNLLFGVVFNCHCVCVYSQNESTLLFFFLSFSSSTCINHFIGFYCLIKIKTIPKCSRITQGLFSVQYVKAAKTDSQEED